jgi:hypothetical protein
MPAAEGKQKHTGAGDGGQNLDSQPLVHEGANPTRCCGLRWTGQLSLRGTQGAHTPQSTAPLKVLQGRETAWRKQLWALIQTWARTLRGPRCTRPQ